MFNEVAGNIKAILSANKYIKKLKSMYKTLENTEYGVELLQIAINDLETFLLRIEYYQEIGYLEKVYTTTQALIFRQEMWNRFMLQYIIQNKINYKLIIESNKKLKDYY